MFEIVFYILMVAPSPSDNHTQNYAIPLGTYPEAEFCMDAKEWLDEQQHDFPRHIWCMPVTVTFNEGDPA